MTQAKRKTTAKRTPRETTDRMSTLAAGIMRALRAHKPSVVLLVNLDEPGSRGFTVGDLRSLCACVLSQDQTRGKRAR